MYDINDFLNYASNGVVSAPDTTRKSVRKTPSPPVQRVDMDTHLRTFIPLRTLPSGPIMVHTYPGFIFSIGRIESVQKAFNI